MHPAHGRAPDRGDGVKKRTHARTRHRLPLALLRKKCGGAPAVYLALVQMRDERGGGVITPTRAELCALTGITRLNTISAALTALHEAGWIRRKNVPDPTGKTRNSLLRITVPSMQQESLLTEKTPCATKIVAYEKSSVCNEKRSTTLLKKRGRKGSGLKGPPPLPPDDIATMTKNETVANNPRART